MKFSTIVLALATIVAAAPSATAEYVCHTEAVFTYASEDTPSISTKAQEFLGSLMVDTFNAAYATEDTNSGNTRGARKLRHGPSGGGHCGPLCDNDDDSRMLSSEVVPDVRMLRHGSSGGGHCGPLCDNDDDSRMLSSEVADDAGRKLWRGWSSPDVRMLRHGSSGGGHCGPLCDNDDDSRMLTSSEVVPGDHKLWTNASHGTGSFTDEFGSLKEHMAWEKLVLENGRTHTELAGLKDCKIVLSDCHIE